VTHIGSRLTGALADRYRIERDLGAGGVATVYLAHDVKHDRKVAIKVLRPELAAILREALTRSATKWYYSAQPQERSCPTTWGPSA